MVYSYSQEIIQQLRDMGFYDIVLPWLFAFAISLPILRTIFKRKKGDTEETIKVVPELIAMVIAFFAVYYTPFGQTVQGFFTELFGGAIMVLAGLFLIMLILAMFNESFQNFLKCPLAPLWALITGEKTEDVIKKCNDNWAFRSFGLLLIGIGVVLTVYAWRIEIPMMDVPEEYIYLGGVFLIILFIILLFKQKPPKKEGEKEGEGQGQNP